MKIKAIWVKKDFNPFFVAHTPPDGSMYSKTIEVSDDTDMDELKKFAIEDSEEGYEFQRFEKVDENHPLSPKIK